MLFFVPAEALEVKTVGTSTSFRSPNLKLFVLFCEKRIAFLSAVVTGIFSVVRKVKNCFSPDLKASFRSVAVSLTALERSSFFPKSLEIVSEISTKNEFFRRTER